MNRAFLDILYENRAVAQHLIDENKKVELFDGSPGSCHAQTHNVELMNRQYNLSVINKLIDDYLKLEGKI